MSEINKAVRSMLESVTKSFNKVADEQSKLNDKRAGSYTGTVQAAIEAGSLEAFAAAYESLKTDVSANTGNIGKRLGCGLSKPDSEGNTRYVMPSGMMSAVSVVKACMERGISLTEKVKDASGKEVIQPRTFGDLRKAKAQAEKSEADAKLTPVQAAQAEVRALAHQLAEGANALTVTQAQETCKILRTLLAVRARRGWRICQQGGVSCNRDNPLACQAQGVFFHFVHTRWSRT